MALPEAVTIQPEPILREAVYRGFTANTSVDIRNGLRLGSNNARANSLTRVIHDDRRAY